MLELSTRRNSFTKERTGSLIDSRRSDWEEKTWEETLEKIWMRLRIYFKKINGIFFQNALRKEQKQFIERKHPC
jgi:hypothetical protein